MKVFISGGCKNGKSYYAQRLAMDRHRGSSAPLYYVATMDSVDSEDDLRIQRHKDERAGWGFTTIEMPRSIEGLLSECNPKGTFLLDSLTALLANEMFLPGGDVNLNASEKIARGLQMVLDKLDNIVIVSDYIYSDAFAFETLTEKYRKNLAYLDCLAAKHCEMVLEVAYTQVICHKSPQNGGFCEIL